MKPVIVWLLVTSAICITLIAVSAAKEQRAQYAEELRAAEAMAKERGIPAVLAYRNTARALNKYAQSVTLAYYFGVLAVMGTGLQLWQKTRVYDVEHP
jgi:hypothetical protein